MKHALSLLLVIIISCLLSCAGKKNAGPQKAVVYLDKAATKGADIYKDHYLAVKIAKDCLVGAGSITPEISGEFTGIGRIYKNKYTELRQLLMVAATQQVPNPDIDAQIYNLFMDLSDIRTEIMLLFPKKNPAPTK